MDKENIKTRLIQPKKRNVNMRIILTIIFFSLSPTLHAQIVKRNKSTCLYALAIDYRINQGDSRIPKSIVINDNLWNDLKQMQSINYSIELDSLLNYIDRNFQNIKKGNESTRKPKTIKANKILPYLKKEATIYKEEDWSLEASSLFFSEKGSHAVMILRASSKIEMLDICIYFFEQKNGKWILLKELSPSLI